MFTKKKKWRSKVQWGQLVCNTKKNQSTNRLWFPVLLRVQECRHRVADRHRHHYHRHRRHRQHRRLSPNPVTTRQVVTTIAMVTSAPRLTPRQRRLCCQHRFRQLRILLTRL